MTQDANELFVAGNGHIYLAPYGTTMPNDIDDALDSAFQEFGYTTEDGFRLSAERESTDIFGWQSINKLRSVQTSFSVTISLDFLQSNEDIFQLYFGGGSFAGTVYTPPAAGEIDERSLVADVVDGARSFRFWFPKVVVSASREVGFTKSAAATWGVDLSASIGGTDPLFGFDYDDSEFPAYPYP